MSLSLSLSLSIFLVMSCLLIILIQCLKGHKSLGSLFECQNQMVTESVTQSVTRSPIELFWTAKKPGRGNCYFQDYIIIHLRLFIAANISMPFPPFALVTVLIPFFLPFQTSVLSFFLLFGASCFSLFWAFDFVVVVLIKAEGNFKVINHKSRVFTFQVCCP